MDQRTCWQTELGQEAKTMSANTINTKTSVCVSASTDASVKADKSVKKITITKVYKVIKECEVTRETLEQQINDQNYSDSRVMSEKELDRIWELLCEKADKHGHIECEQQHEANGEWEEEEYVDVILEEDGSWDEIVGQLEEDEEESEDEE